MKRNFTFLGMLLSLLLYVTPNLTAQIETIYMVKAKPPYTCGAVFTDDGGTSVDYGSNRTDTLTIYPATAGSKLKVTFSSFSTEQDYDYLEIFDGISASQKDLVAKCTGSYSKDVTATNTEGALTFVFISDGDNVGAGWVAALECVTSGPSCATLSYPSNGATGISLSTELSWYSVSGATSYDVIKYKQRGTPDTTNTTNTYLSVSGLEPGTTYYWTVKPKNETGTASGCSVSSFTTQYNYVKILSPNGGEMYTAGDTINFKFNLLIPLYTYLYISYDDGATWNQLTYMYSYTGDNSYDYIIPKTNAAFANCRFKVYSSNISGYNDISDASFEIKALPPSIDIFSPYEGDFSRINQQLTISYMPYNSTGNYKFYYSLNNGLNWNYIGTQLAYSNNYSYYYWTVPGSITGYNDNSRILITNEDSSIVSLSKPIILTNESRYVFAKPSKNEIVNEQQYYSVKFTNRKYSGYSASFYYSLDAGTNWTYYTYLYPSQGENTYNWYIPEYNQIYDKCILMLYDATDKSYAYSDTFTIKPSPKVNITSPYYNYLAWSTPYKVIFNTTLVDKVNIEYSLNNGSTWTSAASKVSVVNGDNAFAWNVPSGSGTNKTCKLRITDTANVDVTATTSFYIMDKYFKITSPNGGESITAGDTLKIKYNLNDYTYSYSYFQLSFDNGNTWSSIGNQYSQSIGQHEFDYVIPYTTDSTSKCKVKVYYSDVNNPAYFDESDNTFSIKLSPPFIKVTTPTADNFWRVGQYKYINWSSYKVNTVNLYYSLDNGSTWNLIANNVNSYNGYNNYYYWQIPAGIKGFNDNSLIKVTSTDGQTIAISNNLVLTDESPVLISQPAKGTQINVNTNYTVEYTNRSDDYYYMYLYYSNNAGANWSNSIYLGYKGKGSYTYTLNLPKETYGSKTSLIAISDNINSPSFTGKSDTFEIVPAKPTITIEAPAQAAYLAPATETSINWTSLSIDTVRISYSINGGSTWKTIIAKKPSVNGKNSYTWITPAPLNGSKTCLVKVANAADTSFNVTSGIFTISNKKQVEFLYPSAGATTYAGDELVIRYNNNGNSLSKTFYLMYSTDGGNYWTNIGNFYGLPSGEGSYNLTIPTSVLTTKQAKIGLFDNYNGYYYSSIKDTTHKFTIIGLPPSIQVTAPLAGDYYNSGYYRTIKWKSLHNTYVKIEYTLDNKSWTSLYNSYYSYDGENSLNWSIPYVTGTTKDSCRVKITSTTVDTVTSTSGYFTISSKSPVTIVSPNGGETLQAGTNAVISYNSKANTVTSAGLYYALNEGSWNYITTFYNIPAGTSTYQWSIPTSIGESDKYKLIIYDNNYYGADTSNAYFTIKGAKPSISVTSPNYNTIWWTGDNNYIYFTTVNVASVNIDLSKDGGATWSSIATNVNTSSGYYYWNTASVTGTNSNCQFKITSTANSSVVGYSGIFTIKNEPVHFTILTPNGGELVKAGNTLNIEYNNDGKNTYSNIQYSLNNGSTWNNIVTYIYTPFGKKTYSWSIPSDLAKSKTAKIRVVDYYNSSINDESDGAFTLQEATPFITCYGPDKDAWWTSGQSYNLTFQSLNVTKAIIEFSTDAGNNWKPFDTVDAVNGYNYITVEAPKVDDKYAYSLIKVRSAYNTSIYGTSSTFTLANRLPQITVITPNGGESYLAGSTLSVKYNNEGQTSAVAIFYSADNGSNWNYLDDYVYSNKGDNIFNYSIPLYANSSNAMLIRVKPLDTTVMKGDRSDAVFSIKAIDPYISVTNPVKGDVWWSEAQYTIYWNSAHVEQAKIEYTTDNKKTWNTLALANSNNGYNSYSWYAPVIEGKSDSCFIKITDSSRDTIYGLSNRFTISNEPPVVTVVSPNGGETYDAGNYIYISYNIKGRIPASATVYLSTDNGKTKKQIATTNYVYSGNNYASYLIPKDNKSYSTCKVYVYAGSAVDSSNAAFSIKALPPYIKVSSPAYLSYLVSGNIYTINWTSWKASLVEISYSTNNGSTWNTLATEVSSGETNSYTFTAPAVSGTFNSSLIRIKSLIDKTTTGTSSYFTLSNVPIAYALTTPNGGETLKAGNTYTIKYTKTGPAKGEWVYFYVSSNGGVDYQYIGANYYNGLGSGEFNWSVDKYFKASKYCKIKISGTTEWDESNATFEILPAPASIQLSAPYANAFWLKGSYQTISWNSLSVDKVNIYYSIDPDSAWVTVASNVNSYNGYNSYTIEVPSVVGTKLNASVKVRSSADTTIYAVSPSFTMSANPITLTVLSPNGGEVFKTGSSVYVEYNYQGPPVTNVYAYISADGGYTWKYIQYQSYITEGKHSFKLDIPNDAQISNYYKINISTSSGAYYDYSDKTFSIVEGTPKLTISSPVSSNYWVSNDEVEIAWESKNVESVNLYYSNDAGETWKPIASSIGSNSGYNTYNWTVPALSATYDNARIKVASAGDSKVYAISASFMMSNVERSLAIVKPYSSQKLTAGSYYTFEYVNNGPVTQTQFRLKTPSQVYFLGTDNYTYNGNNKFELRIPEVTYGTDSAIFEIRDVNNYNVVAETDSLYSIIGTTPIIKVKSPDSTAYWTANDNRQIAWYSVNVASVKIEYTINNGTSWDTVATNVKCTNGDNYFDWTVKDIKLASKVAQIRISKSDNAKVNALSDKFTLSGTPITLTMVYPNGGEQIKGGTDIDIRFKYTGDKKAVKLYISNDNGLSWNIITTVTAYKDTNVYSTEVPFDATLSDKCLIRAEDEDGVADTSNAVFSIIAADPTLEINAPLASDYWVSNTIKTLSWFSWNVSRVNLQYTINGGTTWVDIRKRVPTLNGDNKLNWTIPVIDGTFDAKVRVVDASKATVMAESETFTLTNVPVSFTITSPAEDSVMQAGTSGVVKYKYNGPSAYASIYLSVDTGASWTSVQNYAYTVKGDNSITVNIPKEIPASNTCLIRVENAYDASVYAVSDTFSMLAAPPSVVLSAPNASDYWISGGIQSITWESFNADYVKLEYSTNNGTSWTTIKGKVTSVNGLNKYNWKVASVTGSFKTSKVRVSYFTDSNIKSESQLFTISDKYPSIDAGLKELTVDGTLIAEFDAHTLTYKYYLPYSSTEVPVIAAVKNDANATMFVQQAGTVPGWAYVSVVAEDGLTSNTYYVNFIKLAPSKNAALASLKLNDVLINGFASDKYIYDYKTNELATLTIEAIAAESHATVQVSKPGSLPGAIVIVVTAEDGITKRTYEVKLTEGLGINNPTEVAVNVFPNPTNDVLRIDNATKASIYLYNFNGQLIQVKQNLGASETINVSSFKSGMYLLKIVRNNEVTLRKVEIVR